MDVVRTQAKRDISSATNVARDDLASLADRAADLISDFFGVESRSAAKKAAPAKKAATPTPVDEVEDVEDETADEPEA